MPMNARTLARTTLVDGHGRPLLLCPTCERIAREQGEYECGRCLDIAADYAFSTNAELRAYWKGRRDGDGSSDFTVD